MATVNGTPRGLRLEGDRYAPFGATMLFKGWDLSNSPMQAQLRLYRDQPGDPVLNLPKVTVAGATGLRFVDVVMSASDSGRPWSTVAMQITKADMRALPSAGGAPSGISEIGDDTLLVWDLILTPPGGVEIVALSGIFTVLAGVTQ